MNSEPSRRLPLDCDKLPNQEKKETTDELARLIGRLIAERIRTLEQPETTSSDGSSVGKS